MVNKTPLRLVAIEESPTTDDEQDLAATPAEGTPVRPIAEHEAITRKVEAAATIAARDGMSDAPKRRFANWQSLVPAGAVAIVLVAVVAGLVTKSKGSPAPSVATPTPPPAPVAPAAPEKAAQPQPAPVPAPAPAPIAAKPIAETIHLQITADPVEAELSLDGNVLAGHRLNLEVPRDRGIHVVSASAPGYLPFNQQVSFASDVLLSISLRRSHAPAAARTVARAVRTVAEPKGKSVGRPATSEPGQAVEPGMNLGAPSARSNAKAIDERNPYAP